MKKSFLLVSLLISIILMTSINSSTYSQVKKQNNINQNDVLREKLAIRNKQIFDSIEYTKRKLDSINKVEYNIRQIKLKMKNEAPIHYRCI